MNDIIVKLKEIGSQTQVKYFPNLQFELGSGSTFALNCLLDINIKEMQEENH